jgi:uncharacterized membrane protein YcaP (DUF421 family)
LKREAGAVGITDLLVIVLIADAAQNAMAGGYTSVTDGVILVATILFWSNTLNWLGSQYPQLARFIHPPPLMLVENGHMLRQNMRRELITPDELMSELRASGVEDISQVKKMYMEGNGQFSVIRMDNGDVNPSKPKRGT